MKKPPTDIGVSVRARLLRLARERGEDFQLVLTQDLFDAMSKMLASDRGGR